LLIPINSGIKLPIPITIGTTLFNQLFNDGIARQTAKIKQAGDEKVRSFFTIPALGNP
jgi:hypothetical protein